MGAPSNHEIQVRQALVQRLESLSRAGIDQLPRWRGSVPPLSATPEVAPSSSTSTSEPPAKLEPKPTANSPADTPQTAPSPTPTNRPIEPKPTAPAANRPTAPIAAPANDSLAQGNNVDALNVLSEEVRRCERCPELVANRSQTVFGVGNPNARLCFFGEAPGADEDRQGEPFVGAAGQLLDKIINACKMQRDDVYILNTVKCRPPGNRNPSPDEITNCRPFFEQQLEIIRPEFICCLGAVPAQTLLETQKSVGRLRGTLHSWRFAQVLVTYHPAYLLRNPSAKKMVWEDMKYLMAQMGIDLT